MLERRQPPIDKACGEGLMPAGVSALRRLGVDVEGIAARSYEGLRYVDGEVVAEGRFTDGPGLGVRRLALHGALVQRASELGVRCRWGVVVESIMDAGDGSCEVNTSSGAWEADWVVGADGLRSRVRDRLGLSRPPPKWQRFGVRRHYQTAPWSSFVEVHWAKGCEAYITPVGDGEIGVAFLWSGDKASFAGLLSAFPVLEERLRGVAVSSKDRGAGPFRQRVGGRSKGRVVLIGDAGGYVDALTGEGLGLAFQQAALLPQAFDGGDLRAFEKVTSRLLRSPELMTHMTLLLSRYPRLRPKVVRLLAADPALFSHLLAVQNHQRDLWPAGVGDLARLCSRLLLPS